GEQLQKIGAGHGGILLEQVAGNTAPAIALAALHLVARDPDATMLELPADHLIENEDSFRQAVHDAARLAEHGWLVTFGIAPEHPETGNGYIHRGDAINGAGYQVRRFVEQP